MKRFTVLFGLMVALAIVFSACASAATPTAAPATSAPVATSVPTAAPTSTAAPQTLTVFAAASLTGAFGDIGKVFEAANPGVTVKFQFCRFAGTGNANRAGSSRGRVRIS